MISIAASNAARCARAFESLLYAFSLGCEIFVALGFFFANRLSMHNDRQF
jgi:hypothetical protein